MAIITVTGTPGTGKTVVARELAKRLNYDLLILNDFIRKKKLYEGREHGSLIVPVNKLVKEFKRIKNKKNMVVDGHLSHFLPSDFCIVLRCDPHILEKRLKKKKWHEKKIRENIEAEILGIIISEAIANKKAKHVIELNATKKKPTELAKEAEKCIKTGKNHMIGVDWLRCHQKWLER